MLVACAPNARLVERVDLTPAVALFTVAPDEGPFGAFEPGQYVRLGLPRPDGALVWRPYTVASAPAAPALELCVARVERGALTALLWSRRAGDPLWLDPRPRGRFTLRGVPASSGVAALATGTGVAPFASMLRHYGGRGRWRRFVLVHGARRAAELAYRAEFEAAGDLVYLPTLTREPQDSPWRGARRRLQALLEPATWRAAVGEPLAPDRWHVFLCGNPAMISSVTALLAPLGFHRGGRETPGNLHYERYW